jgi:microcystin-dependent protein
MADPFRGEIRLFSFSFAPKGWAPCNGQLLPINQNQALFALLGTLYGGDGRVTFALPNLRGQAAVHVGGPQVGGTGGAETVDLTVAHIPTHGHLRASANQATSVSPVNNVLANAPRRGIAAYGQGGAGVIPSGTVSVGGGQPHNNMQPFLTLEFAISLDGIFPNPNPPNPA